MGETGYSRRNLGLTGSAKNATSPTNLAVIMRQPPRFKIRARTGRIFPRRSLCFMFQSPIRRSDHMQNAPVSEVTPNGKRLSRAQPRDILHLAVASWSDRSYNKRYRL